MTASEWLSSTDPQAMLAFLRDRGPMSERKLRLFAVACCRRLRTLLTGGTSRRALTVAERYADGVVPVTVLHGVWFVARRTATVAQARELWEPLRTAKWAASEVCEADIELVLGAVARAAGAEAYPDDPARMSDALGAQVALLLDIFGNPFRPVSLDAIWRTEAIVALARGVYDERAFERLPVLADALEAAGCDSTEVLEHCRGPNTHVRGCWLVDLVMGKT